MQFGLNPAGTVAAPMLPKDPGDERAELVVGDLAFGDGPLPMGVVAGAADAQRVADQRDAGVVVGELVEGRVDVG